MDFLKFYFFSTNHHQLFRAIVSCVHLNSYNIPIGFSEMSDNCCLFGFNICLCRSRAGLILCCASSPNKFFLPIAILTHPWTGSANDPREGSTCKYPSSRQNSKIAWGFSFLYICHVQYHELDFTLLIRLYCITQLAISERFCGWSSSITCTLEKHIFLDAL